MNIKDDFKFDDLPTGLKLSVVVGDKLDRLHVENIQGGCDNRDFWFTKEGEFDGTGSCISEEKCKDLKDEAIKKDKEPQLGCATTRALLQEVTARIEINGNLDYRTIDEDVDPKYEAMKADLSK